MSKLEKCCPFSWIHTAYYLMSKCCRKISRRTWVISNLGLIKRKIWTSMTHYFPVSYVFVTVDLKVTLKLLFKWTVKGSVLCQAQISYTYEPTCNYPTYRTLGECSHRRLYKLNEQQTHRLQKNVRHRIQIDFQINVAWQTCCRQGKYKIARLETQVFKRDFA